MGASKSTPNKATFASPIVYSKNYNIGFMGLENLHPFDSKKYEKIHQGLIDAGIITSDLFSEPEQVSDETLLTLHSQDYLDSLKWSYKVAFLIEVPPIAILPNFLVRSRVLVPMMYATGGSLLAAKIALEHGWAINLSGGYHHASAERGGGFCIFADISLIVKQIYSQNQNIKRFMIIDLDAHQGNGYETDKVNGVFEHEEVFIYDAFNQHIYPNDLPAIAGIDHASRFSFGVKDEEFLHELTLHLPLKLEKFKPEFVIYNAGTDCLENDCLGGMQISAEGIIKRDEIVFKNCFDSNIPVVMLLSGGYQKNNAAVIVRSILNLNTKFGLLSKFVETNKNQLREETPSD